MFTTFVTHELFWIKFQTQDTKVVLSLSEKEGMGVLGLKKCITTRLTKKENNELQLYLKTKKKIQVWKLSSDRWIEAVTTDVAVVPSETHLLPTGNKIYATETL